METLRFAKHVALGNDFLIALVPPEANATFKTLRLDWPVLAAHICNRGQGVGADGLILGTDLSTRQSGTNSGALVSTAAGQDARIRMTLLNSDGSSAAVSGNGLACLANEVARTIVSGLESNGGTGAADDRLLELTVDTADGSRLVSLDAELTTTGDGSPELVDPVAEVHMPNVVSGPSIDSKLDSRISESFGCAQRATGDVGNPHLIINAGRPIDEDETVRFGTAFEKYFPDGINVEFIWSLGQAGPVSALPSSIGMAVWERGAGLTLACGTGAVTSAVQARTWGLVDAGSSTVVEMPGGMATISCDTDDGHPVLEVSVEHLSDHEWPLQGPWRMSDG